MDKILNESLSYEVAKALKNILRQKNMTQKEFASFMGRSESEICKWMSGKHNFTLNTLECISMKLSIKLVEVNKIEG